MYKIPHTHIMKIEFPLPRQINRGYTLPQECMLRSTWGWFSSTSGWHLHLFLAKRHLKKLTLAHGLKWIRHLGASHLLPLPNACEWSRLTFSFLFNMNAHQSRNFQRIRCLSAYQRNRYAKISIDRSDVKRWQSFCVEHRIPGWWDPDSHLHSHKKKPDFSHGKIMGMRPHQPECPYKSADPGRRKGERVRE